MDVWTNPRVFGTMLRGAADPAREATSRSRPRATSEKLCQTWHKTKEDDRGRLIEVAEKDWWVLPGSVGDWESAKEDGAVGQA